MEESSMSNENETGINIVELATELTAAWLSNPNTRTNADDVPAFLISMHSAMSKLTGGSASSESTDETVEYTPAVTARKSLASPDHIISLIDGKPYKTLKRHLTGQGLTPAQYRERYNLKDDYPMVAATYSEARRDMAKRIGLGRKPDKVEADEKPAKAPAKSRASKLADAANGDA
jgi:predicted transcriptional regulator